MRDYVTHRGISFCFFKLFSMFLKSFRRFINSHSEMTSVLFIIHIIIYSLVIEFMRFVLPVDLKARIGAGLKGEMKTFGFE